MTDSSSYDSSLQFSRTSVHCEFVLSGTKLVAHSHFVLLQHFLVGVN